MIGWRYRQITIQWLSVIKDDAIQEMGKSLPPIEAKNSNGKFCVWETSRCVGCETSFRFSLSPVTCRISQKQENEWTELRLQNVTEWYTLLSHRFADVFRASITTLSTGLRPCHCRWLLLLLLLSFLCMQICIPRRFDIATICCFHFVLFLFSFCVFVSFVFGLRSSHFFVKTNATPLGSLHMCVAWHGKSGKQCVRGVCAQAHSSSGNVVQVHCSRWSTSNDDSSSV